MGCLTECPARTRAPLHASSFYYCCYVYFGRRHLQHIDLDYTHLDCKTTKCICIRNCLAHALPNLNWKRRLQGSAHKPTHTHASPSDTCGPSRPQLRRPKSYQRVRASTAPCGRAHVPAWHPHAAASLLASCREVEFGNQRGRKRADAKRVKPLAAPEGGCLSAGLGERSEQGFSFSDGIFWRA